MNYLDAYDIRGDTDAPAQPGHQTLNEEVSQLASNLTGFWKGFVKQSSAALQTGLQEVAQQAKDARKELNWIATGSLEEGATASGSSATTEKEKEATSAPTSDPAAASSQEEDKENEKDPNAPSTDPPTSPTSASFNFLSKLQSSIPPSLVSTVQNALPDSVKQHAAHPGSVDFAALRTTLSSEFQRVAGVTRAQAEEYVHRSEGLIREAVKHGGDLLKDAVKVVPPDPNLPSGTANTGVVWDGTDVWAFDALPVIAPSSSSSSTSSGKGKEKVPALSSVQVQDAQKAVATRAEALLKRLRHDPEILKADPDADASLQDMYPTWIAREVVAKDGGINGVEWAARIEEALGDGTDGKALQATYNALVPAKMTRETFWTRYFFRVYQIQREEARRKALLEGTHQSHLCLFLSIFLTYLLGVIYRRYPTGGRYWLGRRRRRHLGNALRNLVHHHPKEATAAHPDRHRRAGARTALRLWQDEVR
ncbi:hypothetical protein PUNSTDRAFT_50311 [Punctularia strigosozonata HHB-11173 SS5]|uniref:uncharacterized protein n=1 Tax=Punctularia strigosozonata (strain HHB-11173) TaxID=741275 RepID=UPI0004417A23|nr:uncharacterized protein PUNSTDRAFT_50311 [Punctularia strigosozonata HHB-11173 SS5]EIN11250.1 hypothetical protein PUNSTDRAFT_50311 [Punctularia strigosozonata HHB-11173 SS5]